MKEKKVRTAYLYFIFLGLFGAHKFYLGQIGLGMLYLCVLVLMPVVSFTHSLMLESFYITSMYIWAIGLVLDLFTLGQQVRFYNMQAIILSQKEKQEEAALPSLMRPAAVHYGPKSRRVHRWASVKRA